jgi:hypothetical protein
MKADTFRFFLILLILPILLISPANLLAYDYQVIFSDDFQSGSTQNWIQENGAWSAANFQFCVEECSD